MSDASETIDIQVPMDALYELLVDFDAYSTFLGEVSDCRRVGGEDGVHLVDYTIQVIKRIQYQLRFVEERPTRLKWELANPGKIIEVNSGSWDLEPIDEKSTRATYSLSVKPRIFVPRAVVTRLTNITLPSLIQQFKAEAERRHKG
jgi:coenzyme Q-binding protein COQ10